MVLARKVRKRKTHFFKKRRINLKKGLQFVPNLFTLGNAFFGFCSIVFAAKGDLLSAAYFILLGALMDSLDGRMARLIGVASDFGVQLDSLSDAISFCLAPALLVYFWQLRKIGFIGIIVASVFLLAGLMRLARFNVIHEKQTLYFLGVPSTAAGCFISIVLLNFGWVRHCELIVLSVMGLVLLLAFLMVSSIRFPTFKQQLFRLNKNWYMVAFVVLFAVISVMQLHVVLLILFLLYFCSSFVVAINFRKKKKLER
jgi:CDP-diacylglycerol---serine O-phosphatidyltransferase